MKNLKSIYIKIEKPNFRQRFIIVSANLLLWMILKFFKDDEEKMKFEIKDVIINACKVL